jgi:hypothetical protein
MLREASHTLHLQRSRYGPAPTLAMGPDPPLSRRGGLPLHRGMLQRLLQWLFHSPDTAPPATLLIRLMAGGVFLWEGVMKFVFPHTLGVGRFLKLGIPSPEFFILPLFAVVISK